MPGNPSTATWLLLGWIACVLVFFSATPGKRHVYILPALPALIACVIGLACFMPFILGFKGVDRALLLGSAVVFLSGAIGMEMIGGSVAEVAGIDNLRYRLLATAEESLEFAGLLLFLLFLLRRLRALRDGLTLRFE